MSGPTTILDFGILKLGDGAVVEVFTAVCLVANVSIAKTTATSEKQIRDCINPNLPATTRTRVTSTAYSVELSGIADKDQVVILEAAFAKKKNFKIEARNDDSTNSGALMATWAGGGIMTALSWTLAQEGESSFSATIAGTGALPATPAP
jgi:hypothetical protein